MFLFGLCEDDRIRVRDVFWESLALALVMLLVLALAFEEKCLAAWHVEVGSRRKSSTSTCIVIVGIGDANACLFVLGNCC